MKCFSSTLSQLIFLFSINFLYCQDLPNITPPSPTAYELTKIAQIPVGFFTGTTNVNVPLYTFRTQNLTIPISLSYNSNGIKVDQISTNIGLGWSLNAGGVISRIVRDESDETNQYIFPEEDIHDVGMNSPMALDYFYLGGEDDVDTETDLFMYNFMGYSGSFVFSNEGGIILMPHKDIAISGYEENGKAGFQIITSDGIKYIFLEEEITRNLISGGGSHPEPEFFTTAWYLSKIIHPSGDIVNFIYENQGYSYVLSESQSITLPTPTYQYACNSVATGAGYSMGPILTNTLHVTGKRLIEINSLNVFNGSVYFTSNISNPEASGLNLISNINIKDKNNNVIETFDFDYLTTSNNRVFLEKVNFKDPKQNYVFDYIDPNGLPSRLSKAQDHWGYFNGKTSNTHYFPNPQSLEFMPIEFNVINFGADKDPNPTYAEKGLLKKIYYPTKGYNEFTYEANNYYSEETIYPSKEYLILHADTGDGEFGSAFDAVGNIPTIPYDHMASLVAYASFNSQECEEDMLKSKAYITVTDNQTSTNVTILELQQQGYVSVGNALLIAYNSYNNQYYFNLEEGHSYTVRLHPTFQCTNSDLIIQYYDEAPTTQLTNLVSGGLRIKEIKAYTAASNQANITRYYYGQKESLNQSSGERGQMSYYLTKETNRISCSIQCANDDIFYTTLNASSLRPLFNSIGNSTTYYNYVTVSYGGDNFENGGEENEFIIHNDYPGNPLKGEAIENSPWVNLGWSNGLLKTNTIFKKDGYNNFLPVKQTINNYVEDNRYFEKIYGYSIRKKFDLSCYSDITYECTSSDITKTYSYKECIAPHSHSYLIGGWPFGGGETICIASGANNQTVTLYHPCYGKTIGYIVTYPNYLENLDITEYSSNSYWYYLSQSIEKQYDENGLNPIETITDYNYDNPSHLQVSRIKSTTSDSKSTISKTLYASDIASPSAAEQELVTQHRIAEPIEVKIYKDQDQDGVADPNELLSTQYNEYYEWITDVLVLPKYIKTSKGDETTQNRIQFHDYYGNGNPKELSKVDGTHIVYIWGYNQRYPIAKIENVTYSQVSSQVSNLETLSDADNDRTLDYSGNEGALRIALESFRSSLPDAMVTTYTYDPLIGVTSITDPKGYTMYYEYDEFNRLKQVKDGDGNIISENEYNYKQ